MAGSRRSDITKPPLSLFILQFGFPLYSQPKCTKTALSRSTHIVVGQQPMKSNYSQQLQQKSRDQLWLVQTRSQVCHQANHSGLSDRLYKMRDESESCMKRLARIWEWEILTAITERKNRLKLQLSLHWIPALPCLCAPGQAIASLWPLSSSPVNLGIKFKHCFDLLQIKHPSLGRFPSLWISDLHPPSYYLTTASS